MSENQTPKKPLKSYILSALIFIVSVGIGACIGVFGAAALDRMTDGNSALFYLYLGLSAIGIVVAYFFHIIVHEGGHLIFGLLSGYRFVSFNVLGFIWQKGADGKIQLARMHIAGAAGQCLMAPPEYNDGDYPFTLYNLGGVLMNLLFAALFGLLAWLIPVVALRILFFAQAAVGIWLALLNGLPIPVAAIQNDGKNLLCIHKDGHARRAFWVQMAIAAELAHGTRIKSMPEEWFNPFPEEAMDNPIVSAIAVYNTSRLMDRLDLAAAECEIRTLLARKKGILGLHRMTMNCDGAVCELIAGHPADLTANLASAENQQLMKAMKAFPSCLRTRYALALLKDRDPKQAQRLLDEFEAAALKHPFQQEITGERELILAIQNAMLNGGTNP